MPSPLGVGVRRVQHQSILGEYSNDKTESERARWFTEPTWSGSQAEGHRDRYASARGVNQAMLACPPWSVQYVRVVAPTVRHLGCRARNVQDWRGGRARARETSSEPTLFASPPRPGLLSAGTN